jgi:nicotinamidase-related amidase
MIRITKENTIGLVIDIQERLYPAMFNKEEFLKSSQIFIEGLGILGIPVIATQQYTKGLGETLGEIKSIIPGFNPIEKTSFSCCDEPLFEEKVNSSGAKNILVCGIEAHVCVLQTAVGLKGKGFNPVVVADCISSRTRQNVELSFERFRHEGILMASYESILFELLRSAGSPEFKAISKLVK